MDFLIELFRRHPELLIVAAIWVFGILGSVVRAAKKARERAEAAQRPQPVPRPEVERTPPARSEPYERAERSEEEIAREMRRILGTEEPTHGDRVEHPEKTSVPPPREPEPAPELHHRPLPVRHGRQPHADRVEPERAPTPVVPTTASRRLQIHVDPHVGEAMQRRGSVQSGRVGGHAAGHELGRLGGRVQRATLGTAMSSRYALDDLKRALVLSEILGPPLSLRPPGERG